MKKLCLVLAMCFVGAMLSACSDKADDFVERPYPMDQYGNVDTDYAIDLLEKKCRGDELSETDEELVKLCAVEGDNGMAVVDEHGIGMQKVMLKLFKTLDGGKKWSLLEENFEVMSGYIDCVYLGDKILFSNYAGVTEETNLFFVTIDGELEFPEDDFYDKLGFENHGLQADVEYDGEKQMIVCKWSEAYSDKVMHTTYHDVNLNLVETK